MVCFPILIRKSATRKDLWRFSSAIAETMCKDYKKDIFGSFAYDFELSKFLVKYRLTPK